MKQEKFQAPKPEDKEMYEQWLKGGGRKNPKDVEMDFELRKMLENMREQYGNLEFAGEARDKKEVPSDIRIKMRKAGWDYEGEMALDVGASVEETLAGRIGNPDYKIIAVQDRFMVFRRHEEEKR